MICYISENLKNDMIKYDHISYCNVIFRSHILGLAIDHFIQWWFSILRQRRRLFSSISLVNLEVSLSNIINVPKMIGDNFLNWYLMIYWDIKNEKNKPWGLKTISRSYLSTITWFCGNKWNNIMIWFILIKDPIRFDLLPKSWIRSRIIYL